MFETASDIRRLLARVAREVRDEELEVHAFAVVANHFHLLVRSLRGELSKAMHRIEHGYVRQFNLQRDRDGPLLKSRFFSRRIETLGHRRLVVRYIDRHGVGPGRAESPFDYPHCSAHAYAHRPPPWLETSWILSQIDRGEAEDFPQAYTRAFDWTSGIDELIEARLRSDAPDPLDDLIGAAPPFLRRWFEERARLADGQPPGLPVVPVESLRLRISAAERSAGPWFVQPDRRRVDAWRILEVALLRELAGLIWARVAREAACAVPTARKRFALHKRLLAEDGVYAERIAHIAAEAIEAVHGGRPAAAPAALDPSGEPPIRAASG